MVDTDLFRTRDHVPDFDDYVTLYRERSRHSRATLESRIDVPFGDAPGERLDLFFPADRTRPAPIHLFIHGGYWRMFDKAEFSFVADTVCAAGGIAAIMNYDLMPQVRMATIVGQVRACASWLTEKAEALGGDATRLTVSGHSAGGHLGCFLATEDSPVRPEAVLALSGIYDLAPLRQSFLQPDLGLTEDEVARFSPVSLHYDRSTRLTLMVGETETRPFHEQAEELRQVLRTHGCPVALETVAGAHHMSIVAQLGDPGSIPGRALSSMIRRPQ